MGTSYHTKIGPYLVCSFENQTKLVDYKTCSNDKCEGGKNALGSKFCPFCGFPVEIKQKEQRVEINSWNIYEKIDEELCPVTLEYFRQYEGANIHIFIPNVKCNCFTKDLDAHYHSNQEIDLTEMNLREQLTSFEAQFKKSIDYVKKQYKTVELRWGIICYTS